MVNKLRGLAIGGGGLVIALSLWGLWYYGLSRATPWPFLWTTIAGFGISALPWGMAQAKRWSGIIHNYLEMRRSAGDERGSVFVSESSLPDPDTTLEAVEEVVDGSPAFDSVQWDAFPEGEGLTVTHTGFHNTFVRVTRSSTLAVTGASIKTRRLAREIEEAGIVPFRRAFSNPFERPDPVRGAPRVFFGLVLAGLVISSTVGIAAAAYPTEVYNPAEKTVLMAIDARSSVDPGVTHTEHRLAKAAFLVDVLDEKQVEILWARNDTEQILDHGRHATAISTDAREELAAVQTSDPTAEEAQRAARIESELHRAEREVAAALERRAEGRSETAGRFDAVTRRMRRAANTSVRDWSQDR